MEITNAHKLTAATQVPLAGGSVMNVRRCLVVHFTNGATALSSIEFWKTKAAKGASAHLVIDRDGALYQCRPFNRTCGHAGVSRWMDPVSRKMYSGLNSCSIGIELANAGEEAALALRWTRLPLKVAAHRNGGDMREWEAYPAAQLNALRDVSQLLVGHYHLDDVTGHDAIAPERKLDPGPAFPMEWLREACGFKGLPAVYWPQKAV